MSGHNDYMREAIALSRSNMQANKGGPFGAVIVKDGAIIGRGGNNVTSANDPTAHAEVVAIRQACQNLGTFSLEGAAIYTSCEPCPMCLAAIYWARIGKIYYANTKDDAASIDFDDAFLYKELVLPYAERSIPLTPLLREEAVEVFREWSLKDDKVEY